MANIHNFSKEFAKQKIQSFAGQKNFSGRSLKYIYNFIIFINYYLSVEIISVFEDCYCNSYEKPDEMKNDLINEFDKKPKDYNEIINYLRRDEEDISEKYEPLYSIINDYVNNQTPFNFTVFLDYLDCLIFKDIKDFKEKIEKDLLTLENKKINNQHYIFYRIIYNILSSLILQKAEDKSKKNTFLKLRINDIELSKNLDSIECGQKKYLLLRKLIEKNYIKLYINYVEYSNYLYKIQNDNKIENPFFELFKHNINLLVDSITLG